MYFIFKSRDLYNVPVIQNVSTRQETYFYAENTCLGKELTKQVELFEKVPSTGFPGSSKSKKIFGIFFDREQQSEKFMGITDKKDKNRFFRQRKHIFPNFFYLINLSVDNVYNARKIFRIATLYQKIYRKITFDFEDPGNPVEGTFSKSSTFFANSLPKQVFSA